jgi:hypothetical protein
MSFVFNTKVLKASIDQHFGHIEVPRMKRSKGASFSRHHHCEEEGHDPLVISTIWQVLASKVLSEEFREP